MIYSIDYETRSAVDLPTYGLDLYATDPSTQVLCLAYSQDGGPVKLWTPGTALPAFLYDPNTKFQAFNAAFEKNITEHVLGIPVRWDQFIDSMAICAANNVPQSLEEAAMFLGTADQKDPIGKRLIQKLCKPHKGEFNNDPELLQQLYEYCKKDVLAEQAIVKNLRPLSDEEQRIWVLTNEINDYGVPVDPDELSNAVKAVQSAQKALDEECIQLTGCKPSERAKLLEWLNNQGAGLADLTAETVIAKIAELEAL